MSQRAPLHERDAGLTLIELLVVIVVLGILAGIAVFGVAQFRDTTVSAACKADEKVVKTAASAYELKQGVFPTAVSELETAGYVSDPPSGVTYTFDGKAKTVEQDACNLEE